MEKGGFVTQETIIFSDTIRNNVLFGRSNLSEEKLVVTRSTFLIESSSGSSSQDILIVESLSTVKDLGVQILLLPSLRIGSGFFSWGTPSLLDSRLPSGLEKLPDIYSVSETLMEECWSER